MAKEIKKVYRIDDDELCGAAFMEAVMQTRIRILNAFGNGSVELEDVMQIANILKIEFDENGNIVD